MSESKWTIYFKNTKTRKKRAVQSEPIPRSEYAKELFKIGAGWRE